MLALIAGRGRLPGIVAKTQSAPPFIVSAAGVRPEGLDPQSSFTLETIASFLATLHARNVTEVCFAGAVTRPAFDPDHLEPESQAYAARILSAAQKGDNGALIELLSIFEEAGFTIRAAHDLAPHLLPPPGANTARRPDRDDTLDVQRAHACIQALGQIDMGQSCVVNQSQIIAAEAKPGTDWMLDSLKGGEAKNGILFKAPKPDQDRRVDLPTIGPGTVERAANAGLRGIVIEAGGVMVIDHDDCVASANAAGMFLWVYRP